jgi:antitoxin CptB
MEQDAFVRRKKIRYMTARRANLELEYILQAFWRRHGTQIPDEDLPELERILSMEDLDLLEILLGRRPIPRECRRDLFELLLMK